MVLLFNFHICFCLFAYQWSRSSAAVLFLSYTIWWWWTCEPKARRWQPTRMVSFLAQMKRSMLWLSFQIPNTNRDSFAISHCVYWEFSLFFCCCFTALKISKLLVATFPCYIKVNNCKMPPYCLSNRRTFHLMVEFEWVFYMFTFSFHLQISLSWEVLRLGWDRDLFTFVHHSLLEMNSFLIRNIF